MANYIHLRQTTFNPNLWYLVSKAKSLSLEKNHIRVEATGVLFLLHPESILPFLWLHFLCFVAKENHFHLIKTTLGLKQLGAVFASSRINFAFFMVAFSLICPHLFFSCCVSSWLPFLDGYIFSVVSLTKTFVLFWP